MGRGKDCLFLDAGIVLSFRIHWWNVAALNVNRVDDLMVSLVAKKIKSSKEACFGFHRHGVFLQTIAASFVSR